MAKQTKVINIRVTIETEHIEDVDGSKYDNIDVTKVEINGKDVTADPVEPHSDLTVWDVFSTDQCGMTLEWGWF